MGRIRKIHAMDIRDVDLNLLVVFDAMARTAASTARPRPWA
jgi:hypothetical protein